MEMEGNPKCDVCGNTYEGNDIAGYRCISCERAEEKYEQGSEK